MKTYMVLRDLWGERFNADEGCQGNPILVRATGQTITEAELSSSESSIEMKLLRVDRLIANGSLKEVEGE